MLASASLEANRGSETSFVMSFVPPCCVAALASTTQRSTPPRLFVFGLGYVGLPLAVQMKRTGFVVNGITQSKRSFHLAEAQSIPALATESHGFESVCRYVDGNLKNATHLLSTVPPDAQGDPILRAFMRSINLSTKLTWLGYISSTSVYGNHSGGWVHETSPSLSPSPKGQLRLAAEREWTQLSLRTKRPTFIFRPSGIYGTGRSALHTLHRNPSILSETSSTKTMIVSRVHLTDIVNAISIATSRTVDENRQPRLETINLSDDQPASREQVFRYAGGMLNLKISSGVSNSARYSSRHRERYSKRVSNAKMKRLLLPQLTYPSFREGLESLVHELRNDWT